MSVVEAGPAAAAAGHASESGKTATGNGTGEHQQTVYNCQHTVMLQLGTVADVLCPQH
jgi:hypothetical protein